jgi:chromosome segregation ATPase
MNREQTLQHLAEAEDHVAIGMEHIGRQREIVTQLEREGRDVAQARALLEQFEQLQEMHVTDRDRLLRSLQELREDNHASVSSARVQHCRERAAHCERMASRAHDPEVGLTFADAAEQWRHLARQIERLEHERAELSQARRSD